jgi:hypothetical protein
MAPGWTPRARGAGTWAKAALAADPAVIEVRVGIVADRAPEAPSLPVR